LQNSVRPFPPGSSGEGSEKWAGYQLEKGELFKKEKDRKISFSFWNFSGRNKPYVCAGNLHTHSKNSDGMLIPEEIVNRYQDQGYDFLSLTDHNIVTDTSRFSKLSENTHKVKTPIV